MFGINLSVPKLLKPAAALLGGAFPPLRAAATLLELRSALQAIVEKSGLPARGSEAFDALLREAREAAFRIAARELGR